MCSPWSARMLLRVVGCQAVKTGIRREDLDLFLGAEQIGELALSLFVPSSAPSKMILGAFRFNVFF